MKVSPRVGGSRIVWLFQMVQCPNLAARPVVKKVGIRSFACNIKMFNSRGAVMYEKWAPHTSPSDANYLRIIGPRCV